MDPGLNLTIQMPKRIVDAGSVLKPDPYSFMPDQEMRVPVTRIFFDLAFPISRIGESLPALKESFCDFDMGT